LAGKVFDAEFRTDETTIHVVNGTKLGINAWDTVEAYRVSQSVKTWVKTIRVPSWNWRRAASRQADQLTSSGFWRFSTLIPYAWR